jgi:4a-hydroxytetrahydrobiopterin dehydratase
MTRLAERRCQPCRAGTPPLAADEAQRLLAELDPGWSIAEDGKAIRRAFRFEDFYRTMAFVNAIAWIANTEDHHPDLQIGYNYCRVRFSTHAIGGLSTNDFVCAAKVDSLQA